MDNVNVLVSVVINIIEDGYASSDVNIQLWCSLTCVNYHNWIFTSKLAYTSSNININIFISQSSFGISLKMRSLFNLVNYVMLYIAISFPQAGHQWSTASIKSQAKTSFIMHLLCMQCGNACNQVKTVENSLGTRLMVHELVM